MTPKITELLQSIVGFKDATKAAIVDMGEKAVEQTNVLMVELDEELQRQILEFGTPAGGDFQIATTEAYLPLVGNEIDVGAANHFSKTITANTQLSVTNIPTAPRVATFITHIRNGGAFTLKWWPRITWAEGVAPKLSANGRDVVGFSTLDGGATWDGYLIGKDMKLAI